ncbi:GH3 auxin-responsive promoter family protein [soil metagenome]
MALLGKAIKGAIHLKKILGSGEVDPVEAQEKVLKNLLTKAKSTAFGKKFGFKKILASKDIRKSFALAVPCYDYDKIYKDWWYRLHKTEADVCWPGTTHYFALSSGTTGKDSKRIPVTADMIKAIRDTSIQQILCLSNFDLPAEVFEKEILMLGSSTDLTDKGEYQEGEISGISASNIPFWFERYYKPGKEIAGISDWDQRVHEIAVRAPEWDIGALSGIPAWIQLMLEKIIKHYNLKNIHEIWPNLTLYATGGVALEPYLKNFEKLLGRPLYYIDTYLASEGFLAFQTRPDTQSMALVLDHGIYFEFIPFDNENFKEGELIENPKIIGIDEVEEGKEYALLISTCAGTWRYMIGDTIRFTDLSRHEIVITGRTKFFLNVAGSQLSVEKMDAAIKMLEDEHNIIIKEYLVSAVDYDGAFAHKWYIGSEDQVDTEQATSKLDTYLKEINKNYKVAREKALKKVFLEFVSPDYFYKWHADHNKMGGQTKTPRVMKADQFAEWEKFVETH